MEEEVTSVVVIRFWAWFRSGSQILPVRNRSRNRSGQTDYAYDYDYDYERRGSVSPTSAIG